MILIQDLFDIFSENYILSDTGFAGEILISSHRKLEEDKYLKTLFAIRQQTVTSSAELDDLISERITTIVEEIVLINNFNIEFDTYSSEHLPC